MKVSAIILTLNEARNLPRCLDALQWCDDIIVIDSGSTDGTVLLARERGARVLCRSFDNFAAQRNFGLSEGYPKHEWVLHLDADEVLTKQFILDLIALEPPKEIDAYNVPSKLMLYDRWLRHAGTYPVYQVRLGHRDRLRFKQVGHGQREDISAERIGVFNQPYLHFNFSHGISAWLRKHVEYAKDEALLLVDKCLVHSASYGPSEVASRRFLKTLASRLPMILRPFARAFYMLVVRRGFLDGRPGLLYVFMLFIYECMIAVHYYDIALGRRLNASRTNSPDSSDYHKQ